MAVIANGLVIGVSSDFIPRLVYRYHYGPCVSGNNLTQSGILPKPELQTLKNLRRVSHCAALCVLQLHGRIH